MASAVSPGLFPSCKSARFSGAQGTPAQGRLKELLLALRVGREQFPQLALMPGHGRTFGRQMLGEETTLRGVELRQSPRLEIAGEIAAREVIIDKRSVLLIAQIREDDLLEKGGIFAVNEETQLVAGKLRILRALLLLLQGGPLQDPGEFG